MIKELQLVLESVQEALGVKEFLEKKLKTDVHQYEVHGALLPKCVSLKTQWKDHESTFLISLK